MRAHRGHDAAQRHALRDSSALFRQIDLLAAFVEVVSSALRTPIDLLSRGRSLASVCAGGHARAGMSGIRSARGLSPGPWRRGRGVGPQASPRLSRLGFERLETSIARVLAVPPREPGSDHFPAEAPPVREYGVAERPSISIRAEGPHGDDASEDERRRILFGVHAERLPQLRAVDSVDPNLLSLPVVEDRERVSVMNADDLPRELSRMRRPREDKSGERRYRPRTKRRDEPMPLNADRYPPLR